MNRDWTNHVKEYAFTHNINYMDALKTVECQELYEKKQRKYEGIKELRKQQNELVINYLNKKDITKEDFQKQYLDIERRIKNKTEDSKRYREHYKNRCVKMT
jgi:hypothetical protein